MTSAIDPTKPETVNATTASVRANFGAAKTEIEELQEQAALSIGDVIYSFNDKSAANFLPCNGQPAGKVSYAALYAIVGDNYDMSERIETSLINLPTPASSTKKPSFTADGQFMALPVALSPWVNIYQRTTTNWTKLSNPASLPTGLGNYTDFSADTNYLAVAHNSSPWITIYSRSGATFTKETDPAILPNANAISCKFSADNQYLAVGTMASPYVKVYKNIAGTWTKLADPATLPTGQVNGLAWSSDGAYLCCAHDTSPYVTVYSFSADTLTKLADPADLPSNSAIACSWTKDNARLLVASIGNYRLISYTVSGPTIAASEVYSVNLTANPLGMDMSADGKYVLVVASSTPFINLFRYERGQLTLITSGMRTPPLTPTNVAIDPLMQWIIMSSASSPYNNLYKMAQFDTTEMFRTPFIKSEIPAWIKAL